MSSATSKHPNGSGRGGGKSAKEMHAEAMLTWDATETTTSCAFCEWSYTGRADEGRELAKGHRRVHHPEAVQSRRRSQSLRRHTLRDNGFRAEGIENAKVVAASLARLEEAS